MKKLYSNNYSEINLYRKNSSRSEVVTQMIFGNAFYVLNKNSNWWKIKILEDNYKGFIKKRHFVKFFRPTHKVAALSAKIPPPHPISSNFLFLKSVFDAT